MNKLLTDIEELFVEQLHNWDLLKKNSTTLDLVEKKTFYYDETTIKILHNPKRIISTSAKTDKDSITSRPCFLCSSNRPKIQKGIKVLRDWTLLCNPYPILPKHLTIVYKTHIPQEIKDSFEDLLKLSKELKDKYTLFYNGPKHGASAPDHLHFQAVPIELLPIEKITTKKCKASKEFRFYKFGIQKFYYAVGTDKQTIVDNFRKLYKKLQTKFSLTDEPGLNILCNYKEGKWKIIIFPRVKHRPSFYYLPEPEKFLISPASIDLAGVVVFPRKKDFEKIDSKILKKIFAEVI